MRDPTQLSGTFGRYQILSRIGAGGMGTVYLALDTKLNRRIALKVPHFGEEDDVAIERFYREAQVAAGIEHPNICPVFDINDVDGIHYFTMPYIDGLSLAHQIDPENPWSGARATRLVGKLAVAMAEMHRRGVVHRDLKPGNIMMRKNGEPVLLDFGLARDYTAVSKTLTSTGLITGTPEYMSPEQYEGDTSRVGPASDIYSLGVILYQLATGRPPYTGNPYTIYGRILRSPPPPPSHVREELDEAFDGLCLLAMARHPENRFPGMTEFTAALENYAADKPKSLSQPLDPSRELFNQKTTTPTRTRWFRSPLRHLSIRVALFVAIFLTAAAGVGYWLHKVEDWGLGDGGSPRKSDVTSLNPHVEPGPAFQQFDNRLGMTMVWVRTGTFMMGDNQYEDEKPAHRVDITRPLAVSAHEVTVGQFRAFVDDTGYVTDAEKNGKLGGWGYDLRSPTKFSQEPQYNWRKVGWKQSERHPVVNVSWNDAVAFCEWLSAKEKGRYELPTEAEWEFVARAGGTSRYCCGDDEEKLTTVGNVADASFKQRFPNFMGTVKSNDGFDFTAPVGSFERNAWGLYDVHGNVWEWCKDGPRPYQERAVKDPVGPTDGPRVLRGGSWFDDPAHCRCSYRGDKPRPTAEFDVYIGFRVVLRDGRPPP